ncbi:hypothetical protein TYRP_019718 [Tyrophagus putrescentiae]|nr:hypothetical protein TYRP_019718 [Tyrophagus putrescentiae]
MQPAEYLYLGAVLVEEKGEEYNCALEEDTPRGVDPVASKREGNGGGGESCPASIGAVRVRQRLAAPTVARGERRSGSGGSVAEALPQ